MGTICIMEESLNVAALGLLRQILELTQTGTHTPSHTGHIIPLYHALFHVSQQSV